MADEPGQRRPRLRLPGTGRRVGGFAQLDVHDHSGELVADVDLVVEQLRRCPGGQAETGRPAGGPPDLLAARLADLRGLREQGGLVGRIEHRTCVVVQHHRVAGQGEHDPGHATTRTAIGLEEPHLVHSGVGEHGLLDLHRRRPGQRDQQRFGVLAPAGEVDRAEGPPRHRVADRDSGAGECLEVFGVVLMAEHVRRRTGLQRRPDPVGPDELLVVTEAARELHPVQMPFEVGVGGPPAENHAGRVGQDDADRLAVELLMEPAEYRLGTAGEFGVQIGIAQIGQLDLVGRDTQVARPAPGRQDGGPDATRLGRLGGEETDPGRGQVVGLAHDGPRRALGVIETTTFSATVSAAPLLRRPCPMNAYE